MKKITLEVRGLYRGSDLPKRKAETPDGPGIYVWGITESKNSNNFVPLYVGKHNKSVWHRVEEHFLNLHFGNKYRIFSEYFYERLFKGDSLIPKKPEISRVIFNRDCIFSCDPNDPCMSGYRTGLKNYSAKVITSQGVDLKFKGKKGYIPIQQTIDRYYSAEQFAFLTFLPVSAKFEMHFLEENVKFALKRGTLSDTNSFNPALRIELKAVGLKTQANKSLNNLMRKVFSFDSSNCLNPSL